MVDSFDANTPNRDEESAGLASEYIRRAVAACESGDVVLGVHLYLAAFEESLAETPSEPSESALAGLKSAWRLACANKERSLAEYIFEKLEPYLEPSEVPAYASQLQDLALDRLEEFGLSRDDLEDMADMVARDILGVGAQVVKVEHIIDHPLPKKSMPKDDSANSGASDGEQLSLEGGEARSGAVEHTDDSDSGEAGETKQVAHPRSSARPLSAMGLFAQAAQDAGFKFTREVEVLDYSNLAGYHDAVKAMREVGIGLRDDADFENLVDLLNERHGLASMPALDTLVFRSPAREDAHRFVAATIGELKLPVLRMHMEENLQGLPLLCVTVQADDVEKSGSLRDVFAEGGVLVLDDIDLWGAPSLDDEQGNLFMMQLSRGAREAVNLIGAAVDNPDVYVFATVGTQTEVDGFFLDMLEPISVVNIDYPTPEERLEIWMDVAHEHPSMRAVNRADLVRLSANMPRYDIYMAAREALEEAYKQGLAARRYVPVSRDNIFDKLAAYQPLDSVEYHELEESVVADFRADLEHIDDILKG